MQGSDDQLRSAALLADPSRRALYAHIRAAGGPVTRDEAAARAGLSRKLAAFHLDRLVHAGLLQTRHAQPAGRRGPGRPAKLYQPTQAGIELSIPARQYALLATILLDAMATTGPSDSPHDEARQAAQQHGAQTGQQLQTHPHPHQPELEPEQALHAAAHLLNELGFEPTTDHQLPALRPRNCPFHQLAAHAPQLVCGLNAAFLQGALTGLGADSLTTVPTDADGGCCVQVRTSQHEHSTA